MSKPDNSLSDKDITNNYFLHAKGLKVKFDSVIALDNVDFYIGKNEIVGILGDNGAGKSTLVKSLIGLYKLQAGELYINDFPAKTNAIVQDWVNFQ